MSDRLLALGESAERVAILRDELRFGIKNLAAIVMIACRFEQVPGAIIGPWPRQMNPSRRPS